MKLNLQNKKSNNWNQKKIRNKYSLIHKFPKNRENKSHY